MGVSLGETSLIPRPMVHFIVFNVTAFGEYWSLRSV